MRIVAVVVVLALASCASPAVGPEAGAPADSPEGRLAGLAFLAGSWVGQMESEAREAEKAPEKRSASLWEAHYTSPAGGLMLGMTKRYKDGKVRFFEFEEFAIEEGKVVVRPYVQGERSVAFALTKLDAEAHRATFEHPGHTPQTLDYWMPGDNLLVVAVTNPPAPGETKLRGFRLLFRRAGT